MTPYIVKRKGNTAYGYIYDPVADKPITHNLLPLETAMQVCEFLNSDRPLRAELPVMDMKPLEGKQE